MADGRVFITEIAGKMAVTKDGRLLGPIEDVVIDTESGFIRYLVLRSNTAVSDTVDDIGRPVISITGLHLDQEHVIVSR
ncbi:MAG: PRC-barrel domain-containing protein [Methanomassiliicoccaceae archaeon]|nr:PRC-barrel domain-containing protein [Methanomassiliicoccaceae archaeon]